MYISYFHYFVLYLLVFVSCSKSETELYNDNDVNPDSLISLSESLDDLINNQEHVVWLTAHRANTYYGFVNNIPENSLPAIQKCIDLGVDIVEIDIRPTRDGVLVLMHDETVDRTTTGSGRLSDLTFEELSELYLRCNYGRITEHRVPTLEEALLLGKDKVYFNLDVINKNVFPRRIVNLVNSLEMSDQVIVYVSTNRGYATEVHDRDSTILILPMARSIDDVDYFNESIQGLKVIHLTTNDAISGNLPGYIRQLDKLTFANILNTFDRNMLNNNYSGLVNMVNNRIDIIQTDYFELADTFLIETGFRLSN